MWPYGAELPTSQSFRVELLAGKHFPVGKLLLVGTALRQRLVAVIADWLGNRAIFGIA